MLGHSEDLGFEIIETVVGNCSEGLGFLIPLRLSRWDLWNLDFYIALTSTSQESESVVDAFTYKYTILVLRVRSL